MKHQIRLKGSDGGDYVSSSEMWEKLKDLPEPKEIFDIYNDLQNLKEFMFPFLRQIVKHRIIDRLKFGACHYFDLFKIYAKIINEPVLNNVVRELIDEGKIERTRNGWYRLPKGVD